MRQVIIKIAIIATMGFFSVAMAVERPSSLDRAIENYVIGLRMDNAGITESAIFNVMKLKLAHPDLNYKPVIKELDRLAEKSNDRILRRKAYLAATFLRHPERFSWIKNGTYEENNAFFELISLRLEAQEEHLQKKLTTSSENE